jgi:hypothetical protein
VLQTRSAVNVANIRREPRFDPRVDLRCGYSGNASLICAPLESSSGTCIGVVQLVKKGVAQFRARDLQLLEVLAVQGGTQLQNRDRHETALRRNVDYSIQVTASLLRCLEVQPSVEVLINRIADRAMHVLAQQRPRLHGVLVARGRRRPDGARRLARQLLRGALSDRRAPQHAPPPGRPAPCVPPFACARTHTHTKKHTFSDSDQQPHATGRAVD